METSDRTELADALRERLRVVADRALYERDPAAHLEQLKAASGRLDAVAARLAGRLDPRLAHFLERGSYVKAIDWLDSGSDV